MINFAHSLFHSVFKDNDYLEFGIITGVMRIAKESIFSGLNNLAVFSVTDDEFADKFGFTQNEVDGFLEEYGLQDRSTDVKEWYDGYQIGFSESVENVYNPWSTIQFVARKGRINTYWDNTSDSKIIHDVVSFSGVNVKQAFDALLQGEQITEEVDEGIIFPGIEKDKKASWSMLLFAGYLTIRKRIGVDADGKYELAIPKKEILYSFRRLVKAAFEKIMSFEKMSHFLHALIEGDEHLVE
jgi:hypothetical protein